MEQNSPSSEGSTVIPNPYVKINISQEGANMSLLSLQIWILGLEYVKKESWFSLNRAELTQQWGFHHYTQSICKESWFSLNGAELTQQWGFHCDTQSICKVDISWEGDNTSLLSLRIRILGLKDVKNEPWFSLNKAELTQQWGFHRYTQSICKNWYIARGRQHVSLIFLDSDSRPRIH